MTISAAKTYIKSKVRSRTPANSFGKTMLRFLKGNDDARVGDLVENLLEHGYDYDWNIFQSKCWQGIDPVSRARWYDMVGLLEGAGNSKSCFGELVAFLDSVWSVSEKKWVPPPTPSITTTIGGSQTQVNLTLLEQQLSLKLRSDLNFNSFYGIPTVGPNDPAAMWKKKFDGLAKKVFRNSDSSVIVHRFKWFYSLTERMYTEAFSRLEDAFGNVVAGSDLKILFSAEDSIAQEIHVDMNTGAFVVSVAGSFVRAIGGTPVKPCAVVVATDVRKFPDGGFLRYWYTDREFSHTPWKELASPSNFRKVVDSGQMLIMASSAPHGGPDRLIPEIIPLLPKDVPGNQYVRFTLFRVAAFEQNADTVRESLSSGSDGVELQINYWNQVDNTIPGWHLLRGFKGTLDSMNRHDPKLIDAIRLTWKGKSEKSRKRKRSVVRGCLPPPPSPPASSSSSSSSSSSLSTDQKIAENSSIEEGDPLWPIKDVFVISIRKVREKAFRKRMRPIVPFVRSWAGVKGGELVLRDLKREGRLSRGAKLTRGQVGCFLSHRGIWEVVVEKGICRALVMEDDATWEMEYIKARALVIQTLEYLNQHHSSWDILLLGRSDVLRENREKVTLGLVKTGPFYGLFAYVVSSRGALKLVNDDAVKTPYKPVDCVVSDMAVEGTLEVFALTTDACNYDKLYPSDTAGIK